MKTMELFLLRRSLCALCVLLWQSALAEVHYVDVNSTNATPPYTNWPTAATNIQDAVDAAVAGDEVVVTNGTYATGARATVDDYTTNRVAVDKPLSVRSVNGAQFTTINGGGSARCVNLTNGASLSGFTLTNGYGRNGYGGGVAGGTIKDCILSGNSVMSGGTGPGSSPRAYGGGASDCTLNNCILSGNFANYQPGGFPAYGGGAYNCTLNDCTLGGNWAGHYGGGAASCTLNNCTLTNNSAGFGGGGGAYNCTMNNCMLTGNFADGGGAYNSTLNNCTVTGNSAPNYAGGAYACALNNCITYFNSAPLRANYDPASTLSYSCTTPQPTNGSGNITNAPLFVNTNGWANPRLQPNSPCINAGYNSYITNATDLDGNPRIAGGVVDIGAYEFQWPQLNISPSAVPPGGIILTWPTNNAGYDYTGFILQSTTNLVAPVWSTNSPAPVVIAGQNTVTNPITGAQQFYRLVQ
jgi:hypothetical protein